jgi:HK97 family phage prohead protease
MKTKEATSRLLSVDEPRRRATFIASTDTVDSYGESVAQNWRLERYLANPVVLYAHDSRALPIGKSVSCGVRNGRLECEIEFASAKANPRAEEVWQLYCERILRAVSVGFAPHSVRREMRNDVEIDVLDDNELFEISVVPIPANPDALSMMRAKSSGVVRPLASTARIPHLPDTSGTDLAAAIDDALTLDARVAASAARTNAEREHDTELDAAATAMAARASRPIEEQSLRHFTPPTNDDLADLAKEMAANDD